MKRKRFSFLTLLVLAIMLLMPTSIQAAVKPGTVKLLITIKSTSSGRRFPGLRITSYTIKKPAVVNGLR